MAENLSLHSCPENPVILKDIALFSPKTGPAYIRVESVDGQLGISACGPKTLLFSKLLNQKVIPSFLNQDARQVDALVQEAYVANRNYKLGLVAWNVIASVEAAILDLLGKVAEVPVYALLGEKQRSRIPVYLSRMSRETTPEEEFDYLIGRIEKTGVEAIKLKIGGRMSQDADAYPGRTEALIAYFRERLPSPFKIFVDANGSYSAGKAIEIGKMLEAHAIDLFEEPCPFEEYDWTKEVADALAIPVGLGEQEYREERFRWLIENRGADVIQPDCSYNGGLCRTLRLAKQANECGYPVMFHNPQSVPLKGPTLHATVLLEDMGGYLEHRSEESPPADWFKPNLKIENGALTIPETPGLGFEYDSEWLDAAERIES